MIEIFYRNNFYLFILSRKKSKYKKVFKYFKQQNIMKRQWKDKYDHIFSGNMWSSYTYFYSIEITHTPIYLLCERRYFLCCCEVDLVSSLFILGEHICTTPWYRHLNDFIPSPVLNIKGVNFQSRDLALKLQLMLMRIGNEPLLLN